MPCDVARSPPSRIAAARKEKRLAETDGEPFAFCLRCGDQKRYGQ
jgi:hypothetical protein